MMRSNGRGILFAVLALYFSSAAFADHLSAPTVTSVSQTSISVSCSGNDLNSPGWATDVRGVLSSKASVPAGSPSAIWPAFPFSIDRLGKSCKFNSSATGLTCDTSYELTCMTTKGISMMSTVASSPSLVVKTAACPRQEHKKK